MWELGQLEMALTCFQQAVEREKQKSTPRINNRDNWLALAHFYLEQDDLPTAQSYLDKVIDIYPTWKTTLLNQAIVLWLMGQEAEALEKLERARHRNWRVTHLPDLRYDHFWRERAVTALQAMLAVADGTGEEQRIGE